MDAHPYPRSQRVALIALAITCLLAVAKVAVWLATSSLAVLSQALDSAIDVVALALVYLGVRIAAKPADESHHYGHAKAENLVAFGQTVVLGAVVVVVAGRAVVELFGEAVDVRAPWYALALLAGSGVVDAFRVWMLTSVARREGSHALQAGAINLAGDIGTAAVALASLGLVRAGFERADPVGALIVAVAVAVALFRLGRRSTDVLMDRAPGDPVRDIERAAADAPGVAETRRVRVRDAGGHLFADVTVAAGRTASLERAHDIASGVERGIRQAAPGTDVVVHVEPAAEASGFVERVQAAASRAEGVHEVHNVFVHAFDEGGRPKLHVTLHAKVSAGTSVDDAHALADRIEDAVARELGADVRVDTHIEPLPVTELGRDVTAERGDVVATVGELATDEADVTGCHEVLVTSAAGELSVVAHVSARGDLPLHKVHGASERIENGLRARHGDVGTVTIHFEPS